MNANDIIEVFEHCIVYSSCSVDCPYYGNDACFTESMKSILALAKRQKAEIEMLNKTIESLQGSARAIREYYDEKADEAIKEFAEKLKDAVDEPKEIDGEVIDFIIDIIDSFVKEMTGEDNDTIL